MANRTIRFLGQGYGSAPATITAKINGDIVFSGSIPTIDSTDIKLAPADQQVLFTFERPITFNGTVPMELTIAGTTVVLGQIFVNYAPSMSANPKFTDAEIASVLDSATSRADLVALYTSKDSSLTAEEIATLTAGADLSACHDILVAHKLNLSNQSFSAGPDVWVGANNLGAGLARSNVVINGESKLAVIVDPSQVGDFFWTVNTAPGETSTVTYNLTVTAGVEP